MSAISIVSTLNGTKTHCVIDTNGKLFAVIDETETYQQHFDNNVWTTWQSPIDVNYPLWFEPGLNKNLVSPNLINATYVEVFDFGIIYNNITINLDYKKQAPNEDVLLTFSIQASDDNISYGTASLGENAKFAHARYIKVTITFTPKNKYSCCNFSNFSCNLVN